MNDTSTPSTCPTCGASLPTGTDLDACPRCLLAAGLGDSEPASGAAASTAPALEEVAGWFPQLEILDLVGQGGMGVVYKARQISLDRVVALKVLPPSLSDDPAFSSRFMREAKTMARLDHANIVRIHEFGETEGRYYLVMEFVDGSNIRQVMEKGGLEPKEALAIVPQVCEALQYAHDRGVVHRDIKPENVLLDRTGRVKLTDFGLAKLVQQDPHDMTLTAHGQVMGTPRYMAPEQYKSPQDVDHRADIYSLGVVFYEMLTGDVPMGLFEPPSEKVEVDVRLDDVVLRTLEKERERRYQRVDEIKTEVASITTEPVPPPALADAVPVDAPAKPPPRRAFEPAPEVPPEEQRWSKLAVAGFLCLPGVLVVPALAMVVGRVLGVGDKIIAISMGLAFLLLFAGFFLSLAGWITTARSKGALKGQGLAIAGTIATVPGGLLLMVVVGAVFFLVAGVDEPVPYWPDDPVPTEWNSFDGWDGEPVVPPEPPLMGRPQPPEPPAESPAPAEPGPTLVNIPPGRRNEILATLPQLESLWAALQEMTSSEVGVKPSDGARLVAFEDVQRVSRMRADDKTALAKQGYLGLVSPPPWLDTSTLGTYRLDRIDFAPMADERYFAQATVRWGEETLTFGLMNSGKTWHFALSPMWHSSDTSFDEPELVKGAPPDWDRIRRRDLQTQVQMLWSIYRGLWEDGDTKPEKRVPTSVRSALLPAGLSEHWRGPSAEALAEKGKYGDLGLLFLDATLLPVPLGHYELKSITVNDQRFQVRADDRGSFATVEAESGDPEHATLTFPVMYEAGRWYFDLGGVKK